MRGIYLDRQKEKAADVLPSPFGYGVFAKNNFWFGQELFSVVASFGVFGLFGFAGIGYGEILSAFIAREGGAD